MPFTELCFFISQIVLIPSFLATTKLAFKRNMRVRDYILYTLISPCFVYFFSMLFYGVLSVLIEDSVLINNLIDYADIIALLISFLFAFIYSATGKAADRMLMLFVYTCFYMVGMVFSLIYKTAIMALFFSVIIPAITSLLMYKYFSIPLSKISSAKNMFNAKMLLLPVTAEALMVLRFLLNIISQQDLYLVKYGNALLGYMTVFGYIVLIYIFLCTNMVVDSIHQIEQINEQKNRLIRSAGRIKKLRLDMLQALVNAIEAKDEYTNGHSNRVAAYSKMIAEKMGMPKEAVDHIYQIALLHDIGKIAIPDEIIAKQELLTNEEFAIIMQHPYKGGEILKGIEEVPDLYLGALYHHERWDGKGYPYGLVGEKIPECARIISVADAYDAMTSRRTYRPPMSQERVINELKNGMGTQFSPIETQIMLDIIAEDKYFNLKQLY